MQNRPRNGKSSLRAEGVIGNVTSAIGMEETPGHLRARRNSLFTQTVIWVTGLICTAFLVGTLAQAWSNSFLMQKVQSAQNALHQKQELHDRLQNAANYYKDPAVIESEARQQLGYVRPGEQAIVIVNTGNGQPQAAMQSRQAPPQHVYWQAWWKLFFG
ncbi:MAG TPA: septum formation initiator family protein [Ktedonobacteraceae bacterium]|nr:septum formation initiator family protein [Ktedonobacteraceae bacterium]